MQFPSKPDVVEEQVETPRFTLTLKPKKVEIKKKKSRQPAEKTETPDKNIKKMASSRISNTAVHSSYPEKDNNSKSKSKEKQPKVSAIREEERRLVWVSRKTIEKVDNLKTLNSDQLREERINVKASIRKFETDFKKLLRRKPDYHEKRESEGDMYFYFEKIKQRMSDLKISKQKRKKPKTKSKSKSKNKKLDIV